jgi:phosphoserine phosphatase
MTAWRNLTCLFGQTLQAADQAEIAKQVNALLSVSPTWTQAGDVAVVNVLGIDAALDVMPTLRERLLPWACDVLITDPAQPPIRLLLADMDSTMVIGETLDDLAAHIGKGPAVAEITASAMNGELDFAEALNARVQLLAGLPLATLQAVVGHMQLMPGAKALIQGAKQQGIRCVLISGGFTPFTQAVATQCGFDRHVGNTLEVAQGCLTGRVSPPIVDKTTKLAVLQQECEALGISLAHTLTLGDGANDIPMLQAAGLGIGIQPKPVVRQAVPNYLLYNDLSALLTLVHKS